MPPTSLLRHVVLFSFRPHASPQQCDAIVSAFVALPARIPAIAGFEWGANVSPEGLNAGFTHCFTLSFARTEDRDAYLAHPAHREFVAQLQPCVEKALVVDYWAQATAG